MIDERSHDGAGWARFSDDRKFRYLIGRLVSTRSLVHQVRIPEDVITPITKVVFVMLNPSEANAQKPDPTWTRCCTFARSWGADITEAVNLDALISPYPEDLWLRPIGLRGDDAVNDEQILEACGAHLTAAERTRIKVVAAWGNHGERDGRAACVQKLLRDKGVVLYRFDRPLTKSMQPLHPLARGKNSIPSDTKAVRWNWEDKQ